MSIEHNLNPTENSFLSQVPLTLLEENILTQFNNPDNFRMDYVASFIDSYIYSKEFIEDSDELEELKSFHDEFIGFMKNILSTKLGIGINNLEEMSEEEQEDLIHFTYRFFIINMKNNFLNVFLNYINENKDALIENCKRKKDVTSQAFRGEISDEDTIILANLSDIMNYVLTEAKLDIDDFLRLCEGEESSAETTLVSEYFDDFILTGNFIEKYARMLRISMRIKIEGSIRNKILKKYREKDSINYHDNNN